jgi:hypothetical protein
VIEMLPSDHPDLSGRTWRKARASNTGQGCVELADLGDGRIALRNSREPESPAHVFTRFEIACLLDGAKKGEFDDLS